MDSGGGFALYKQGAEGRLLKGFYLGKPTIIKERFKKTYRHPDLDDCLTKERMKAEARAIVRCKAVGIRTPALYLVDFDRRRLYMEDILEAITVKQLVMETFSVCDNDVEAYKIIEPIAHNVGTMIGKLHANNIIHGDLTSSNMLYSKSDDGSFRVFLIDFGLSHVENCAEDKGVDLYVLERALLSTHSYAEKLFQIILQSYTKENCKEAKSVLIKFEEVRARGRKRTMVG